MFPQSLRDSRKLSKLFVSLSLGLAAIGSAQAATYYVRVDGGDASQCNGRADAAYPGTGTGQACAWKNPNIALPNSGAARIVGGDTLMIGAGTYQIGSGGYMQKVPSGTSSAKTRILGKPGTKLVGVAGTHRVINLDGSSYVELGNLEITDNSDCVYNHSNAAATCTSTMPWARVGIYATASSNVWIHDVNIHGMAKNAFNAGGLSNWTLERVKMNRNGSAGWDGNVSTGGSNSGAMVMRDIEISWNGCGEKVATGEAWACWAQSTGGYGDGFGTVDTGGQWLIEDAFVHHNTSDGLDLRYMDGADGTNVVMRRVYSFANAGNQVKIKGNSLIENSVLVGHCTYFRGKFYMAEADLCRAYGSTLLLILTGNDVATVRHNTIAGEGDAQIAYGEGTSTDKIYVQNNLVVGFPYYASTSSNTLMAGGGAPAVKSFSGNMGWNVRSCPSGTTCTQNPMLTNMTLASFNAEPLSGSPVIDKAPMISAVTTDFVMGARPTGTANDVGAYEFGAGSSTPPPPPAPTCTRAAPTLTVTGPTVAVAAGTTNSYAISLKNNDSAECAATSFALARTVPSGWTGTLSATALSLSPGATGSATLAVVSPSTAAAGSYGLGVGTSSSVGSTHTKSASATYTVAAPPAPVLTETVSASKTSYKAGETVSLTARVMKNGVALAGASVNFTAIKPNKTSKVILTGTTDSNGYARVSFKSGSGSSSIGTYQLTATATSGSLTTKATTTFSVYK
ncbi:choice-of-anchor Q domain-containing protein [Lysobacter yangpyeongensis]|uniref:Choice-of-anchor Q domain-containing protein n=1 Tax=Lysobacter yangpyeongensis TaxID=346182 RepID=A0ABW0SIQ2_9GAMM